MLSPYAATTETHLLYNLCSAAGEAAWAMELVSSPSSSQLEKRLHSAKEPAQCN